jgi:hypothetical protein
VVGNAAQTTHGCAALHDAPHVHSCVGVVVQEEQVMVWLGREMNAGHFDLRCVCAFVRLCDGCEWGAQFKLESAHMQLQSVM